METLTICKLLASPQSYAGQVVTLEATVVANFEFSALTDDSCHPTPIEVDGKTSANDAAFRGEQLQPHVSTRQKAREAAQEGNQARVTLVGVLVDPGQYFGHQLCCRYRFDVSKLVSVEEVTAAK